MREALFGGVSSLFDKVAKNVVVNVLSGIAVAFLLFVFRRAIVNKVKNTIPKLWSKTPYINFEEKDERKGDEWTSRIVVSNAGNEPAYNVFVYYFEQSVNGKE